MKTEEKILCSYSEKTEMLPLKLWKNLPIDPEQLPSSITPFLLRAEFPVPLSL